MMTRNILKIKISKQIQTRIEKIVELKKEKLEIWENTKFKQAKKKEAW